MNTCKQGHPQTTANTYTHPETGWQSCRVCAREHKRKLSGSTKTYATFYTKMREQEIEAEQVHPEERAVIKLQRERFESYFGKIGEIFKERAWLIRFGVFTLGWQEAQDCSSAQSSALIDPDCRQAQQDAARSLPGFAMTHRSQCLDCFQYGLANWAGSEVLRN